MNEVKAFFVKTEVYYIIKHLGGRKGVVDGVGERVLVTAYDRAGIDRIPMVKSFENSPGFILSFLRRAVVPPVP